ncbi:MAG: NYN domain-containing protein [Candidatus Binatia bacterium]
MSRYEKEKGDDIDSIQSIRYFSAKMAIHLIIDGYNLLGVLGHVGTTDDGERFRDSLLRDLSMYRQRKGHPITVVFDAWREKTGTEHREFWAGVEVVYTKGGEKADQVIQRLARQYGRDCAVVSSDLEIVSTARSHGAFVMKSQEFQVKLQGARKGRTQPAGPKLRSASLMLKQEEEPLPKRPDKKGNPRKLPKAIRNRNRRLKGF